jgi:uncharacterized protein YegP (UPF0339 family)
MAKTKTPTATESNGKAKAPAGLVFEIYRHAKDDHRWRLKSGNGKIVASGEGYRRRGDCLRCVEILREGAATAKVVEIEVEVADRSG